MTDPPFTAPIARHIWDVKYRHREGEAALDNTVSDSWRRVAEALATTESVDRRAWQERFYRALENFRFLPGGRILAGAGTAHKVTLFNCFVMGIIGDSMDGIFDSLKEGALTMQQGGGVGYDFSSLRPRGNRAYTVGAVASGPVSFMGIWDSMCATILSTGARRGAMMGTLRCDHPDIEEFIAVKQDKTRLRHFNISVQVSDAFMKAVEQDEAWPLIFPAAGHSARGETVMSAWPGREGLVPCDVHRRVPARALWEKVMRATYEYAEPGVLFIDRINRLNNLRYRERISATNPCVTGDAWVQTAGGPRQVHELVGKGFTALINGQPYPSGPEGFFSTGERPVLHVRTRQGHSLRLTEDHLVLRIDRLAPWRAAGSWIRAGDLGPGDRVVLHDHRACTAWDGGHGQEEGYLIGLLLGGGTFSDGVAELRLFCPDVAIVGGDPASRSGGLALMAHVAAIASRMGHRSELCGWRPGAGAFHSMRLAHLTGLARSLGITPGRAMITDAVERCSSRFYGGFLRGLFDAGGAVGHAPQQGGRVCFSHDDAGLLETTQRMLLRMGINSEISEGRAVRGPLLPVRQEGDRDDSCRFSRQLTITGEGILRFAELIGFADSDKQGRLDLLLSSSRSLKRERFIADVAVVVREEVRAVFDVMIPGINAFDANGFYVHNCGEIPLPPYGACNLGSINIAEFIQEPFGSGARVDLDAIADTAAVAVRLLDNVIDVSQFPLAAQARQARATRRIGLGITGLADGLMMLGVRYGSEESLRIAQGVMKTICHAAYRSSIVLAREKGPFPLFDREKYLAGQFIGALPDDIRDGIARDGIRNSHLTAIAPTGTISLLANNVSSGIEPVFDSDFRRRVLEFDGTYSEYPVVDYAIAAWRCRSGNTKALPPAFIDARHLDPTAHLAMQASLQPYVDQAISKTINVPVDYAFADFRHLYRLAYDSGLKGCTTFRPNPVTGEVLRGGEQEAEAGPHCCSLEREAD